MINHQLKRIAQTPRAFSNWPALLVDMAREWAGRGPKTLRFRTRGGLTIECPNRPGARVPLYEIFAEDSYRLAWFLGELALRPITVLDIGAHVGTFACRLAQVHPRATIQCFEPSPTTASFLRRNVTQNGLEGRITVVERAVTATTGTAELADNRAASGLNRLLESGQAQQPTTTVQTVAFDEVAADGAAPPDLVKIDCEGGEYELVLGSSPRSWSSVSRVVLEHHSDPGYGLADLRAWFAAQGLILVAEEPASPTKGIAWLSRDPMAAAARR